MSFDVPTRRGLLSAIAFAPVVVAVPAIATTTGSRFAALMRANEEATRRFCSLPADLENTDLAAFEIEQERFIEASKRADKAHPTSWREFTRLFEHMTDDGHSTLSEDNLERLLGHARRLNV